MDICPRSDRQDETLTKRGWNRSARLQQGLQMLFGGLLKSQNRLATVTTMSMAPRQQPRLGNPYAVLVPAHLNLGNWDNHPADTISEVSCMVNATKRLSFASTDGLLQWNDFDLIFHVAP